MQTKKSRRVLIRQLVSIVALMRLIRWTSHVNHNGEDKFPKNYFVPKSFAQETFRDIVRLLSDGRLRLRHETLYDRWAERMQIEPKKSAN